MMETFSTYLLYGLLITNAAFLFAASKALFRFQYLIRRNRAFWEGETGANTQTKINPDTVLSGFLERRLAMLQERVEELARRPVSAPAAQPGELPFEHAARMAKFGATAEELTRTCGLNEAEAKLVCRVHARRERASSAH